MSDSNRIDSQKICDREIPNDNQPARVSRRILFPTEPSHLGRETIRRAVLSVVSAKH